jgi:four helix bundle protein
LSSFDFQRFPVYKTAKAFAALAERITQDLPKGRGYLTDQLQRASVSVVLNIAEGAGEYRKKEKARFYRMALRSGTECAAILDVCECLGLVGVDDAENGKEMLLRVVGMLGALVRKMSGGGRVERPKEQNKEHNKEQHKEHNKEQNKED